MIKKYFVVFALALALVSCQCEDMEENMERYCFFGGDVRFSVGDDACEVTKRLGQPNKTSRTSSCAGVGEDIVYVYNGFRVLAYSENGGERIVSIEITSDAVSTPEGIRLGDGIDRIMKMYGVPSERKENIVEYESRGVRLRFVLSDGSVRSIKYLSSDE